VPILDADYVTPLAISSDGKQIVFRHGTAIIVWSDGKVRTIPLPPSAYKVAAIADPVALIAASSRNVYKFTDRWTQFEEIDSPFDMVLSPDAKWVSVTMPGKLSIVDYDTGAVRSLHGSYAAGFNADATLIAASSTEAAVVVSDVEQAAPVRKLLSATQRIRAAHILDECIVITVSETDVARWDYSRATKISSSPLSVGDYFLAKISPDGSRVAIATERAIEASLTDGTPVFSLKLTGSRPAVLIVRDDGLVAYAEGATLFGIDPNGAVRWTLKHSGRVKAAAFVPSPSMQPRILTVDDERAHLWDSTGTHLHKISLQKAETPRTTDEISISDDGTVFLGTTLLRVSERQLHHLEVTESPGRWGSRSRDGEWIATLEANEVVIRRRDAPETRTVRMTAGHGYLHFTPDSRYLFLFGYLGRIEVIELESARVIASYGLRNDSCVGWRSDGRYKMWGDPGGHFGHSIRLSRFQPGEVPELDSMLRLPDDEPLF
jgi:WD40 repeat protein